MKGLCKRLVTVVVPAKGIRTREAEQEGGTFSSAPFPRCSCIQTISTESTKIACFHCRFVLILLLFVLITKEHCYELHMGLSLKCLQRMDSKPDLQFKQ